MPARGGPGSPCARPRHSNRPGSTCWKSTYPRAARSRSVPGTASGVSFQSFVTRFAIAGGSEPRSIVGGDSTGESGARTIRMTSASSSHAAVATKPAMSSAWLTTWRAASFSFA